MRFWDSSAILPLIVEERTSDYATRYYEANPELVVWWGASVECASAPARLARDGALETRDLTPALQQLQALQSAWNEVQPLDSVRIAAQRLLRLDGAYVQPFIRVADDGTEILHCLRPLGAAGHGASDFLKSHHGRHADRCI